MIARRLRQTVALLSRTSHPSSFPATSCGMTRLFRAGAVLFAAALPMLTSRASASEVLAQVGPANARSAAVDSWSGLLAEASLRTGLPAIWLHDLLRAESNGNELAVSPKGAIGLMQLMPATYAMFRLPLGLGADPFAPRDNIMAGATYLRLLVDRYGWPGALAAYNAGPARLDAFLTHGRALPSETILYLLRFAQPHAARLVGGISGTFSAPSSTAAGVRSSASPETLFVSTINASSASPTSTLSAPSGRPQAEAAWRQSSLFAASSSSDGHP